MRDLRRAFYSLAEVGEEGQFTRRIARWPQMPPSCEGALHRFVRERLLVTSARKVKEGPKEERPKESSALRTRRCSASGTR